MGAVGPARSTSRANGIDNPKRVWKIPRRYHFWLSKQMIKVKRYRTSGNTQRKGTTATSWHIKLVVARSMTDAAMGSKNQNKRTDHEVAGIADCAPVGSADGGCFMIPRAQTDEPATKMRYPAHHSQACECSRSTGSKMIG